MSKLTPLTESEKLNPPAFYIDNPHHRRDGKGFRNPWPSYSEGGFSKWDIGKMLFKSNVLGVPKAVPVPQRVQERPVQIVDPIFKHEARSALQATWLGHAGWLLEFPSCESDESLRVLLDPLWADRAGPTSYLGPRRFSQPPCRLDDLPIVDAICISHDHYDHCDIETLQAMHQLTRPADRPLHYFVGLGLKAWLLDSIRDITESNVVELDWWDGAVLETSHFHLAIYCTPSQHSCARTPFDKDIRLWSSWTFKHSSVTSSARTTCFFAGDTAYRTVPLHCCRGAKDDSPYPGRDQLAQLPSCPAFREIAQLLGPIDLALLPIGCFMPVATLSRTHCSPWDSVEVHRDLGASLSIAMHHGTLRGGLSGAHEPIDLPAKELEAACRREGITFAKASGTPVTQYNEGFIICDIGATVYLAVKSGESDR